MLGTGSSATGMRADAAPGAPGGALVETETRLAVNLVAPDAP